MVRSTHPTYFRPGKVKPLKPLPGPKAHNPAYDDLDLVVTSVHKLLEDARRSRNQRRNRLHHVHGKTLVLTPEEIQEWVRAQQEILDRKACVTGWSVGDILERLKRKKIKPSRNPWNEGPYTRQY